MNYDQLEALFISDLSAAIAECQNIICSVTNYDSYQEFDSYYTKNSRSCYCPKQYSNEIEPILSIYCKDCAKRSNDVYNICLSCFLNGNHEGHEYYILDGFFGNCYCGCEDYIKPSGFCSKHQGCEDDDNIDNYIDANLREVLQKTIFKAAFSALLKRPEVMKKKSFSNWIISFFRYGDGFKRVFVRALIEEFDYAKLIYNIPNSLYLFDFHFYQICTYLMHDKLFVRKFSMPFNRLIYDKIIKDTSNFIIHSKFTDLLYPKWIDFSSVFYSEPICRYNIEHNEWDWVTFILEIMKYCKELLVFYKSYRYNSYPYVFNILLCLEYLTSIQPNEQTQELFDKMITQVFNCGAHKANDTIIIISFRKFSISNQIGSILDYFDLFERIFYSFKSKPNLKIDSLIEELEKTIDINPLFYINKNQYGEENDKLISRFLRDKNESRSFFGKIKSKVKSIFKSYSSKYYSIFSNGASFFLSNPLFDSFVSLFCADEMCRFKLSRFFSLEKYQTLRVKLGIIALKKLLSFTCYRMNLIDFRNYSALQLYNKIVLSRKEIKYHMMPVSILQLMIGIQCNNKNQSVDFDDDFIIKEFFSFEMAREIGLFDSNIMQEKKQLVIFIFLYLSLLLVIDRTMFKHDIYSIMKEKIIFLLKNGFNSFPILSELSEIELTRIDDHLDLFRDIIMKVASKSTQKNDDNNDENKENNDVSNEINEQLLKKTINNDNDDDDDKISDDDENDKDNNEDDKNNIDTNNNDEKENNEIQKEMFNSYIKPIKFYLKDGIECNAISSVNMIDDQMKYLNNEVSKNKEKLLKIQDFESEETYFFHSNENNNNDNDNNNNNNDNSNINVDDFHIHLNHFLYTPTVLSIVYETLILNSEAEPNKIDLNDHIAMNILILISKFIKEEESANSPELTKSTKFDERTIIQYNSLSELITKMKQVIFNYQTFNDNEDGYIENTLNSINFISLLKMKFVPQDQQPKSIIDILMNKGKFGQEVLQRISNNIEIDVLSKKEEKQKQDQTILKKDKAAKLKENIMSKFAMIRNQYHFSDSLSDSLSCSRSGEISFDNVVCSLCSESKKKQILCYPIYIYQTKFPFIVDKPPLFKRTEVDDISVYDNKNDLIDTIQLQQSLETDLLIQGIPENERQIIVTTFRKVLSEFLHHQTMERRYLKIDEEEMTRVTIGANFIVQFGICQHALHQSCIEDTVFKCPVDRSIKNGLLPFVENIPIHIIFKDTETFETNEQKNEESLASSAIKSILSFIDNYSSYFRCLHEKKFNVFVELTKSIAGLIATYDIRVRNLPDSLDLLKNKILARNLFLTTWYAYRIMKKPTMIVSEIDPEIRMTEFQKFIKFLIEFDDIEEPDRMTHINSKIKSIIDSILSSSDTNIKRKEKEVCLFLRRVCLTEYFCLDEDVNPNENEIIDWDEILSTQNLCERYNIKFTSIDITKNEEFEFKPFLFMKFPKELIRLYGSPYNLPNINIHKYNNLYFSMYNYFIKYFNDFDDTEDGNNEDYNSLIYYPNYFYSFTSKEVPYLTKINQNLHYPIPCLFLGKFVSTVAIISSNYLCGIEPFYVDKYGCPNYSYSRCDALFLNEEIHEKIVEQILSGDFSFSLEDVPLNYPT